MKNQTYRDRQGSSVSAMANNAASSMNPMAQNGAQAVGRQPLPYRQAPGLDHQGRSQDPGHELGLEAEIQSSHAAHVSESLSSMSESDRYGLDGLLHMIRNEGSDVGAIAIGQDLTALGLDLSQPEYAPLSTGSAVPSADARSDQHSHRPLYQTFASPFAEPGSRPIEPEFYIPPCYSVQNVRPFHEQVASFADDTLFFIFYSSPRDIMQELAAVELYVVQRLGHGYPESVLAAPSALSAPLPLSNRSRFDVPGRHVSLTRCLIVIQTQDKSNVEISQGAQAMVNQGRRQRTRPNKFNRGAWMLHHLRHRDMAKDTRGFFFSSSSTMHFPSLFCVPLFSLPTAPHSSPPLQQTPLLNHC